MTKCTQTIQKENKKMANKPYDNFVLANEIKDQFVSHLDHSIFCTADASLAETAGMIKKIHRYYGHVGDDANASGAEKLALGAGNTKVIEMGFTPEEYKVQTLQATGKWHDEEEMTDPNVPLVIAGKVGADLFNQTNSDIIAEFAKAQAGNTVALTGTDYFGAFVEAQSKLKTEFTESSTPGMGTFALISVEDYAKIRKALGDNLKYVEAFAREGYIGTVAGTSVFISKAVTAKEIYIATKKAVTVFYKKDVSAEYFHEGNRSSEDADKRINKLISRTYYVAALTDATKAAKITLA